MEDQREEVSQLRVCAAFVIALVVGFLRAWGVAGFTSWHVIRDLLIGFAAEELVWVLCAVLGMDARISGDPDAFRQRVDGEFWGYGVLL